VARYDRTIPPGGEGKITLEVHTKKYQGKLHKTARVSTNDPKKPSLTIGLKGQVWAPIRITPQYARLNGMLGEKIETIVHLQGNKKEPLEIKLASVSISEKVAVELQELEKKKIYQLKIKNKVNKETRYSGLIKLTTNYSEKPELEIRISGNIRPTVELRPKALNFGRMSEQRLEQLKKNGRFLKRPIMVLLNKGKDLEIEKVELEKSLFKAVPKKMPRGKMAQIIVEPIFEKLKRGPNQDTLKIYTNQKDHKVLEATIRFEIL